MATYYAAKISGQWKYKINTWPDSGSTNGSTNSIAGCLASIGAGNTLVVMKGVWLTTDLAPTSGIIVSREGNIIRGPIYSYDPINDQYSLGDLVFDGTGLAFNLIALASNGAGLQYLTLKNNGPTYRLLSALTGTGQTVTNVTMDAGSLASTVVVRSTATSIEFDRCVFKNYYNVGNYGFLNCGGNATVKRSVIDNVSIAAMVADAGATFNFFDNISSDIKKATIYIEANSNARTVNCRNNILLANGKVSGYNPVHNVSTGGATLNVGNNHIQAAVSNPTLYPGIGGSFVDEGGNVFDKLPLFVRHKYPFIIIFENDMGGGGGVNAHHMPSFYHLASALEARGWRGCMAIPSQESNDPLTFELPDGSFSTMWDFVRGMVARGHEVSCHTRHHGNMANMAAMQIRYVGAETSCTLSISLSSGTISTSRGASWILSTYGNTEDLSTAIDAHEDYTCVCSTMTPAVDYADLALPTSLADIAGVDIKTATYTALYDSNRQFDEEMIGGKVDIEAQIPGYSVDTFVFPGNYCNETAFSGLKARGFLGSRSNGLGDWAYKDGFDLFNQYCLDLVHIASDKAKRASWLVTAGEMGGIYNFYTHVVHTEVGLENLEAFLGDVEKSGAMVMTRKEAIAWVKANGSSTDDRNYTFDGVIGQADYHLQPTSPCLGTGTKLPGITADIEGNPLFPPYNIGPYGLAEGALGVALVVNDGPPRNNITRLTGTSATINPTDTYILDDTNGWRIVTGWTAGTANDFFDADGLPITFTGQQLIDSGVGPRFYCGLKGIAGYTVDQDAAANAKIIRISKVPTYIDTLYWSDSAEMDWSASNE